jgi:hypothetical protein
VWQRVKKNSAPVGVVLKCSSSCWWNLEPSEPVPAVLKVKVPFTALPLSLKPPQTGTCPVSVGRLGSSKGTATKVPAVPRQIVAIRHKAAPTHASLGRYSP